VKLHSTFRFLRPTILAITCYLIAIFGTWWLSNRGDLKSKRENFHFEEFSSTVGSLVHPHPSIAAQEVVRIQLEGLSDHRQAEGILQCMTFASPGNRLVTGPLERFGRMVRSKPFSLFASSDRVQIGEPRLIDGKARVLVTLVNGRKLMSFVWVLSKQDEAPYEGCWMTDGVFPLEFDNGEDTPEPTNDVI